MGEQNSGEMVKRRIMLSFPSELATEPVIYNLGMQFRVVTNIYRASITEDMGWMILELEGKEEDIEHGVAWAIGKGVRVEWLGNDEGSLYHTA